ncbi:hypothetical protein IQ243_00455 [Nostocales cyanobacterium LEGE 11386]|nr:hypothetical protein [Nostocales cyanobacterium LEGE 11386]
MARRRPKPEAASENIWECRQQDCQSCGQAMWHRHVKTLKGVVQLRLKIRRCQNPVCESFRLIRQI